MRSSYEDNDVTLLLKDITGLVEPLPTEVREKKIQSGTHYCEMLPLEYKPSEDYLKMYDTALDLYAQETADAVARVSEIILEKGKEVVIVSLARAGTPMGVLIKRFIKKKYGIDVPHYSVSIIRGRGIDKNAIDYILERHDSKSIQFVDGWVGKGAIFKKLEKVLIDYPEISKDLAVLADPAYITELCGTHNDFLIPSSCLNSTISGLVRRTFLREDIIKENDFHGAAYYGELSTEDKTYEFIERIENLFDVNIKPLDEGIKKLGIEEVNRLAELYDIQDINLIKPGIGETTRVLLRRVPWKIVISNEYKDNEELKHIYQLAKEKNVCIEYIDLNNYKCCGLIKKVADI